MQQMQRDFRSPHFHPLTVWKSTVHYRVVASLLWARPIVEHRAGGGFPPMEPANLHELLIAQAVDKKFREGPTDRPSIIRDIALSLDFEMSPPDSRFLVNYVQWRLAHPISPANAK